MAVTERQTGIARGAGAGVDAVRDAVAEAVDAVGGEASGVLVFAPAELDPAAVVAQASAAAGGTSVAGVSSDWAISGGGSSTDACAVAFDSRFQVGVAASDQASLGARKAGYLAVRRALAAVDPDAGHTVVVLLVDTTTVDLADVAVGAYEAAGPTIPLAGGGANACVGDGAAAPWLFAGDRAYVDAVVALAIVSPDPVAVAHAHGGRPRDTFAVVTRAAGRRILELDGRRADEVYLELLGCAGVTLSDGSFERLAVLHPLAQLELEGNLRIRHVLRREADGSLFCSAAITEGAAVAVVEETAAAVVASARAAGREVEEALGCPPGFVLVFDGAARRRIVAETIGSDAAAAALTGSFAGSPAVAGSYMRGEIGRARGPFGDRNHEIVLVAFA